MTICKNVVCRNGGHCNDTSVCVCPVGFEDSVCGTATVAKYLSNWGVYAKIIGSDSLATIDTALLDTTYIARLAATSTPTTFFFSNFNNNAYYDVVICSLDSTNSYHFTIDSISPFQMIYQSYRILSGSGTLNKTKDTINAQYITRHKNKSTNWQVDTVLLQMIKHNY